MQKFSINKISFVFIITAILMAIYWLIANATDVYSSAIVGAIFEILWLPILLAMFGLPVINFWLLIKDRFKTPLLIASAICFIGMWFSFLFI